MNTRTRITDPATDRRNNRGIIGSDPVLTWNVVASIHNTRVAREAAARRRAAFLRTIGVSTILHFCKNVLASLGGKR